MLNGECIADGATSNKKCTTDTPGKSFDKSGNCQPDCIDVTDPKKTFSTPGFHEVNDKCVADSGEANPNSPCDPVQDNQS